MATVTVVVTSNADGTLTTSSTSAPAQVLISDSLPTTTNFIAGIIFQATGVGLS